MAVQGSAPSNWETIRAINIIGIAAGMAYIHQHNVIHRDMGTYNILFMLFSLFFSNSILVFILSIY
ncbi:hypothetical protein M9Y10_042941 [Tritrichomonas musculus]|uniref:Serine-threonine/tyrosine-protein kinase catalytic domain-containing protein n=1 Tax=Tritrichomonas musculus TaxID=1915356 RepID=A0ABR2JYS2_9EUKA